MEDEGGETAEEVGCGELGKGEVRVHDGAEAVEADGHGTREPGAHQARPRHRPGAPAQPQVAAAVGRGAREGDGRSGHAGEGAAAEAEVVAGAHEAEAEAPVADGEPVEVAARAEAQEAQSDLPLRPPLPALPLPLPRAPLSHLVHLPADGVAHLGRQVRQGQSRKEKVEKTSFWVTSGLKLRSISTESPAWRMRAPRHLQTRLTRVGSISVMFSYFHAPEERASLNSVGEGSWKGASSLRPWVGLRGSAYGWDGIHKLGLDPSSGLEALPTGRQRQSHHHRHPQHSSCRWPFTPKLQGGRSLKCTMERAP